MKNLLFDIIIYYFMTLKYKENMLRDFFKKIKNLSNFYEKKHDDSLFSQLILTEK